MKGLNLVPFNIPFNIDDEVVSSVNPNVYYGKIKAIHGHDGMRWLWVLDPNGSYRTVLENSVSRKSDLPEHRDFLKNRIDYLEKRNGELQERERNNLREISELRGRIKKEAVEAGYLNSMQADRLKIIRETLIKLLEKHL